MKKLAEAIEKVPEIILDAVVDVVAAPVKLLGKALSWVGGWF